MTNTAIITHRGLDPDINGFPSEGSYSAFESHLKRGYGIEFDLNFTPNGDLIVLHGKYDPIRSYPAVKEIISLIESHKATISAIHYKGDVQSNRVSDLLIESLQSLDVSRFMIFDLKPETAAYIKGKRKDIKLAVSVAHQHDIERYNKYVNGTLFNVDEALSKKELFDWVWLDEWDTLDKNGSRKTLYNEDVFDRLRSVGFKIALVTPELHATSPDLLGGESHADGKDITKLKKRFGEIIDLSPDAVCTDHPDMFRDLLKETK